MENLALTDATRTSFWRDKRVLLTGHTGFKGSWLTLWLHRLGAKVTGISLPPATAPNLYCEADIGAHCSSHFCDIRDAAALAEIVQAAQPEIVFHLAAQALVRAGYREPVATFATNAMGTTHVLDVLRGLESARVAVIVTTDKVYRDDGIAHGPTMKTTRSADTILTVPARPPAKSSSPAIGPVSWRRRAWRWLARGRAT